MPVLITNPLPGMEPLWSPVVATGGNQWQIRSEPKPQKQAKSVALGCDGLPIAAHGKEGVDGSSPSEGFSVLLLSPWLRSLRGRGRARSVSTQRPPRGCRMRAGEEVEQPDRVLAPVSGEVAVAIDHS